MYAIPNEIREKIYNGGLSYRPIITGTDTSGNSLTLSPNNLEKIDIDDPIIDTSSEIMYVGSFISKKLSLKFRNLENLDLTKPLDYKIKIINNATAQWTPNYQLLNSASIAFERIEPMSGTTTSKVLFLACEANTTYNMSWVLSSSLSSVDVIAYTTQTPNYQVDCYGIVNISSETDYLYTTGDNATYIAISIRSSSTSKDEIASNFSIEAETYIVPIGIFNVETSPEDYYKKLELTALDNAVKFKKNFEPMKEVVGDGITAYNLLLALCDYYGVTLDATNLPNTNRTATTAFVDNTLSGKQYISYIAEIMGCNAKITRDGKLALVPAKQTPTVTINALESKSFELEEQYQITKVRFDNGVIVHTAPTSEVDTGNTLNIRSDNIFINGTNENQKAVVTNVYNAVQGLSIYSLKTENYTDFTLDATDIVTYSLGDNSYPTYYNNSFSFKGSIMGKVQVKIPKKTVEETTNVISGESADEVAKRTIRTNIDQINGTLETVATKAWVDAQGYTNMNEVRSYITSNEAGFVVQEQLSNGDVKVVENEGFRFDSSGLNITKYDENDNLLGNTHSRLNENGLYVYDNATNEARLKVAYDETMGDTLVETSNARIKNYLILDDISRFENYNYADGTNRPGIDNTKRTGFFWVYEEE